MRKNTELDKEVEAKEKKEAVVRERHERGEKRDKKGDRIEER